MFVSLRKLMAVGAGMFGLMFAASAHAGPVVTVTGPTVQLVAPAPPVVVRSPQRIWVPGYVRYDVYGNPIHVAGYWTTKSVTTRRVVTVPRSRTVVTKTRGARKVVVRR